MRGSVEGFRHEQGKDEGDEKGRGSGSEMRPREKMSMRERVKHDNKPPLFSFILIQPSLF